MPNIVLTSLEVRFWSRLCIALFIGIIRIYGVWVVPCDTGMAQLGDTGNGQFVHVVAYYSEFHRTHRAGLFVVVVAVPIIVIEVITHAGIFLGVGLRVVAGLIQGKAS